MSYTLDDSLEMHAHWAASAKWGPASPVNIFYLDHDPELAAQYHADRHVVKMVLETSQLLSTAWHIAAPDLIETGTDGTGRLTAGEPVPEGHAPAWWFARLGRQRVYRATHANHPCAQWVRASAANYGWLWRLGMALLAEYEYRYGRKHACRPVLWTLEAVPPGLPVGVPQSEPPLAMPHELRVVDAEGYWCAVRSYRNYYVTTKQPLLHWRVRGAPAWVAREEGEGANGAYFLVEQ